MWGIWCTIACLPCAHVDQSSHGATGEAALGDPDLLSALMLPLLSIEGSPPGAARQSCTIG
eukprot:COSAG01_NODE_6107_length_3846_cov_1.891113_2_plen_61_part_00